MREPAIPDDVEPPADRAGLDIPGAEDDASDPRLQGRTGAHDARLKGDDERAVVEPRSAERRRRLTDREDLRVRRRVGDWIGRSAVARHVMTVVRNPRGRLPRIPPATDHLALGRDDECTDGHLAISGRRAREGERRSHPRPVPLHAAHPMLIPMQVIVADHPLITHKLTVLRDAATPSSTFRALAKELVTLLAYEATRRVRVETVEIQTPVTVTTGVQISAPVPLIVPILRAGLGMLDGLTALLPTAEVGFLGMVRDEETLQPTAYANRLPEDLTGRQVFVLDPMLATGGSMAATVDYLTARGATDITAICLIGAPEGVELLERATVGRDFTVVLGAIDERLNEKGYIVPGLGDAGDRLYGSV